MIRGLDGDRIRILQNGVNFLDVSSFSADHSVPIDPLIIEQIDVIRGPATLIYGGGAVGGVVNAIDHRIPKEAVSGFTGRAETRAGDITVSEVLQWSWMWAMINLRFILTRIPKQQEI